LRLDFGHSRAQQQQHTEQYPQCGACDSWFHLEFSCALCGSSSRSKPASQIGRYLSGRFTSAPFKAFWILSQRINLCAQRNGASQPLCESRFCFRRKASHWRRCFVYRQNGQLQCSEHRAARGTATSDSIGAAVALTNVQSARLASAMHGGARVAILGATRAEDVCGLL
jgi:hypothetical protein